MGDQRGTRREGRRSAAGPWLLCLCLCGFGAPAGAQRAHPAAKGMESVFVEPRTPVELRRRLAALGPEEIPELFRMAVEGRFPDSVPPEVPPLSDAERDLVREALSNRPRRELVAFLEDVSGRPLLVAERLEAQTLLGSVGSADHLKLLARLTVPAQDRGPLAPELRAGFSASMSAILARDPSALAQVAGLCSESSPGLAGSIVEALASVRDPSATRVMAQLLGRSPGLDPLLLARLSTRGRCRAGEGAVLEAVRRYLHQRDPAMISAAALACGALGDDEAVEPLIGLMENDDARVRTSVFTALQKISGLDFGPAPERWTSWYHSEMRWWDEDAEAELVRIERGKGQEFVRAARAVLEHRLFRDRMAESFAVALRRSDPDEVRLACRALEQLHSSVGVPGLVECLERGEPGLRQAAWKALRAITGVELPPEAASWAEVAG